MTKEEVFAAVFRNSLSSTVCLYTVAEPQVLNRKEVFDGKPSKNKGKINKSTENKIKNPGKRQRLLTEEFLITWSQTSKIYSSQA